MEFVEQEYQVTPLEQIRPHPHNPNVGAEDLLEESVEANGFYGAIIAQKSTGYILAGNHRYRLALQRGAESLPVIWVDVDDATARRILLIDNESTRRGYADPKALAGLLQEIHAEQQNLEGTGYTEAQLDGLLKKLAREVSVPEAPEAFPTYDRDIETEYRCPRCGYEWSGRPK